MNLYPLVFLRIAVLSSFALLALVLGEFLAFVLGFALLLVHLYDIRYTVNVFVLRS